MSTAAGSPIPDEYDPSTIHGYAVGGDGASAVPVVSREESGVDCDPEVDADTAAETVPASEPHGEPCPRCQKPTFGPRVEWCSACGWYPRLGFFVEPDPVVAPTATTTPKRWYQEIPPWAWKLGAGVVVLGVLGIIGRALTVEGSVARMAWALAMFCGGVIAVTAAHAMAYVTAIFNDAQLGPLDFLIRPLSVWGSTLRQFPATFRRVASAGWGLASIFVAVTIVGGLPYYLLWSWAGDKAPPKSNLVHAIVAQGIEDRAEADGDLEGAIEDFTGQAGADEKDKEDELSPEEREKAKRPRSADCVILGYIPRGEHDFESLVLGTNVGGKLRIVALLSDGISPEVRRDLNERMAELGVEQPLVASRIEAKWIEPVLACRVRFKGWSGSQRLQNPYFDEMLSDLK